MNPYACPTFDTPAPRRAAWATLATACALALMGCSTSTGSGEAKAPAAAATATPTAPSTSATTTAAPPGMDYGTVVPVAKSPLDNARSVLVGQEVSVTLRRAAGAGAPAGTYMVQAGDGVFFRCLSSERGFRGGDVLSEVRAVRLQRQGKHSVRVLDLARCDSGATEAKPAAAAPPAAAPAPAPAPAAKGADSPGGAGTVGAGKPGMDARGNVVDSSKVEGGSGRTVKGINNYEGEITGNPAPGSKFTRLQIGMPLKQVTDLVGQPTDQGAYVTGKAWIPFYFGGDRYRFELVYKGQGRLIFAGGSVGDFTSGHLTWIIHNANEGGYR